MTFSTAVMYGICGIAFFFYLSKLPERAFPGLVDIVGHSHQWWHVLIFLALLFWHHTGLTVAMFTLTHGCKEHHPDEILSQLRFWQE